MDMNVRNISKAMIVPMTEATPSSSRRMHRIRLDLLRILFLKATLTMLVPQNRTVKGANREYLNVLRILAICEIMDVVDTILLLARPPDARCVLTPTPQGERLLCLGLRSCQPL